MIKHIILILFFLLSCEEKRVKHGFELDDVPDQIFEHYTSQVSKNGKRNYRLWTDIFKIYSSRKLVLCEDTMIVHFYDEKADSVKSRLFSKKGEWNEATNDVKAIENVKLMSANGKTLLTDTLYYNHQTNQIYSNTNVIIYTDHDTLYGTSFRSDRELNDIIITNSSGVTYQ